MLSLETIYATLYARNPTLVQSISVDIILGFIRLSCSLKAAITHMQPPAYNPSHIPQDLPVDVYSYMARRLGVAPGTILALWDAMKILIWMEGIEGVDREAYPRMLEALELDTKLGQYLFCEAVTDYN